MPKTRKVGTYEWRGNGSIRLTVRAGTDERGKPIRHTKTVKIKPGDERAAEKALAIFVADIEKGKHKKPSRMTLSQFCERWLRDYVDPELKPGTAQVYRTNLRNFILPALGDMKIDKIQPKHILDFYNNLREPGIRKDGKPGPLGPATILKYHNILSSMFSCAVDWKELEENPCNRIKPPKVPDRKPVSLDRVPAKMLLLALEEESLKYRVLAMLGACTGARRGELLGIGDDTLDIDNCLIKIDRASHFVSGKGIFIDVPKNPSSIRNIPFPVTIVPLLWEMISARDAQKKKCGDRWVNKIEMFGKLSDNPLLFTQWNGAPMHPNSIDTWFNKFRMDNNLPENLTFHGLRHTNITLLLKSGVDVGTVADNSGHADKKTTFEYDDSLPSAQREVSKRIDDALDLKNIISRLLGKPVNKRRKKVPKSVD